MHRNFGTYITLRIDFSYLHFLRLRLIGRMEVPFHPHLDVLLPINFNLLENYFQNATMTKYYLLHYTLCVKIGFKIILRYYVNVYFVKSQILRI